MSTQNPLSYKHGTYVIDKDGDGDAIIAKVVEILPDGTRKPQMRIHKNFQRDFFVTNEMHRKYKDKLEWLEMKKCKKYTSTERYLDRNIMRALNMTPGTQGSRKQLFRNPYVFGADIDVTCLLGEQYARAFPDHQFEKSTVAVIDIETNVHSPEKEIIMCSITFKDKVYAAVSGHWCSEIDDPVAYFTAQVRERIGDVLDKRGVTLEIEIKPTPGQVAKACIEKAHEWKPDFLTLWNLDFDMPKIFAAMAEEGYDLEDVMSDPAIPKNLRYFRYARGRVRKQKASGEWMTIPPAEQWHTVLCPASFYVIDAMPVFRILRRTDGMLPSYSLDFVTTTILGEGKLKFHDPQDPLVEEGGLDWHKLMQRRHKGVYLAYNIIDCIRIEELDEKTTDLSGKIGILKGVSHYKDFNSNPRRIADQLHFYLRERGFAIGTTADKMEDELDALVVDMKDWIVTLSPVLIEEFGIKLISDLNRDSTFYIHNADLDIVSTYPTVGIVLNISKETCVLELAAIQGMNGKQRRSFGINLTGGPANANLICKQAFKLKSPQELDGDFKKWLENKEAIKKTNPMDGVDLAA